MGPVAFIRPIIVVESDSRIPVASSQAVAAFHPSPTTIRNLSNSPEEVGKAREIAEPPGA
jgi:hypothetical protein